MMRRDDAVANTEKIISAYLSRLDPAVLHSAVDAFFDRLADLQQSNKKAPRSITLQLVPRPKIAEAISQWREAAGLTQAEAAAALRMSASYIMRHESGQNPTTRRDVLTLARVYGVTDEREVARVLRLINAQ